MGNRRRLSDQPDVWTPDGPPRVSKSDGSQNLDLQKDALVAAGVTLDQIYEDQASGKRDERAQVWKVVCGPCARETRWVWKLGTENRVKDFPIGLNWVTTGNEKNRKLSRPAARAVSLGYTLNACPAYPTNRVRMRSNSANLDRSSSRP